MLVMQEQKFFVSQLAPFDTLAMGQPMLVRHQKQKRFAPKRKTRKVRGLSGTRRNHHVEGAVLEALGQLLGSVLEQLKAHFRIRLLKTSDQPRQNIKRDRRNSADREP